MRNLKRVLALAMALVMTLSLMVIGVSAASYPDADQIDADYTEAITVLTNLGVFRGQGSDNGTAAFAPKAILTRAEASALIYRLMSGDVEDKNLDLYDYSTFGDVAEGEWYTGYVTYAATKRAVVGYGDGNFHPEDEVTGVQVLKIMLCAIGYGQNGEYEGAGWKDNVLTTATDLGLLDGIAVGTNDLDKGASRELVAQLLFNSVTIPYMVQWSTAFGYQPVKLSASVGEGANPILFITLGNKQFGLVNTADEITAVGRKAGTTTLGSATVINTNTPWTDIGYAASVWTVPTPGAKTLTAVSDVTVTGKSLKVTTDGTTVDKSKVTVESGASVYFNGEYVGALNSIGTTKEDVRAVLAKAGTVGVKVDYIDNDNGGRAEVIVVTEYSVATVTGIANESNTGSNAVVEGSTYLIEHGIGNDFASREAAVVADSNLVADQTLAVGDLVTYVEYPYSAKGANNYVNGKEQTGDYYVTVAGLTTGKYTDVNLKNTTQAFDTYVIGGETYVVSQVNPTCLYDAEAYLQAKTGWDFDNIGKNVDVYTDPYGYILHVDTNVPVKDYLFVIRNDQSSSVDAQTKAQVAYANGAIENVYLSNDDVLDLNKIDSHIYSYTTKGSVLTIKGAGCTTFNGTLDAKTQLATNLYMNNSTIVVDVRDVKAGATEANAVYVGWSNMPLILGAELHYITDKNNVITLAFLTDGDDAVADTDFIVYTTNGHVYSVNADNSKTYKLPVIQDGVAQEIELTAEQYAFVRDLGVGIYNFSNQREDWTFTAFSEPEVDSEITWSDGLLKVNGKGVAYNADTVLYTLDIANGKYYQYTMTAGADGFGIGTSYKDHLIDTYAVKTAYVVTSKGVATEIYVVDGTAATYADPNRIPSWSKTVVYDGVAYTRSYVQANNYITVHRDEVNDLTLTVVNGYENTKAITISDVSYGTRADDGEVTCTFTVKTNPGYTVNTQPYLHALTEGTDYDREKDGNVYTFTITIVKDTTVTVEGTSQIKTFTIKYELNGGTEPDPANPTAYTVENKDTVLASIKAPSKAGYEFDDWTVTGTNANGLGNLTYTAKWTPIEVDVDVVVKLGSEDGTELSNLYVAPVKVAYDSNFTFALSDAGYTYQIVGADDTFNAGDEKAVTVTGTDAADGALTIVVIATVVEDSKDEESGNQGGDTNPEPTEPPQPTDQQKVDAAAAKVPASFDSVRKDVVDGSNRVNTANVAAIEASIKDAVEKAVGAGVSVNATINTSTLPKSLKTANATVTITLTVGEATTTVTRTVSITDTY